MAEQMIQDKASEMAAKQTIPAGYKQTEVGVIPEDWDIKELQQICRVPITYGIVQCGPHIVNGIPYIRVSDMTARELDIDGMQRTSPQIAAAFARSTVDEGDIVYALRGKLGFVRSVPPSVAGANLTQGTARISPVSNVFGRYVFWALQSPRSLEQATQGAKGSTFVEITLASLKEIKIPVPRHKEEQKVIADALSDIDELIAGLEQLITKKQAIKTATMQQLLTGRTRLPPFSKRSDGTPKGYKQSELGQIPEDWEVVSLGDASQFINGRAYALHEWESSGVPVIRLQNLTGRGDEYYYSNLQLPERQYCDFGDLLFMWSATFGPVIWKGSKAIYHYHIWKIECKGGNNKTFLFYLLGDMTERLKNNSSSGGTMLHLTKEKMESTKTISPSVEEQTAIGNVLSDMDSELNTLEQKLAKARDLKQGMMQQLLTGRIRLPLEVGV
ncbi:restriction endonuclease subunit S [Aeromonas caviae]|uniref:restriction endonuclease subunit S n=1 Tax=Aeromonas caviae TaxID=648 RepID=UPI00191F4A66|nr:restriction endonuclease subunit S [Aeromonas caviae]MBL0502674.1 restriction endonuclease subunit S [Aeromonas caviae]